MATTLSKIEFEIAYANLLKSDCRSMLKSEDINDLYEAYCTISHLTGGHSELEIDYDDNGKAVLVVTTR